MKDRTLKHYWFVSNFIFIIFYTITLSTHIINIPIRPPRLVLISPIFLAYSLTLKSRNVKSIFASSNFYIMIIFITLPHHLILFPFYIISYFNLNAFAMMKRRTYERYWFYRYMCMTIEYKEKCCLMAYMMEVVLMVFSILFYLIGCCNILFMSGFVGCIYTEYKDSALMQKAVNNVLEFCGKHLGDYNYLVEYLNKLKKLIDNNNVEKRIEKQKNE